MEDVSQQTLPDESVLSLIDTYIGTRIRIRRNLLGLSQEDLAKSMGLSFQQIQKYERGANRISGSRMWQLARLLNVPVSYFYGGVEQSLSAQGVDIAPPEGGSFADPFDEFGLLKQPYERQQEAKDLINAYLNLSDEQLMTNFLSLIKIVSEKQKGTRQEG